MNIARVGGWAVLLIVGLAAGIPRMSEAQTSRGCRQCFSDADIDAIIQNFDRRVYDPDGVMLKARGKYFVSILNNSDVEFGPRPSEAQSEEKDPLKQLYIHIDIDVFTSTGKRTRRAVTQEGGTSTLEIYTVPRLFDSVINVHKFNLQSRDHRTNEILVKDGRTRCISFSEIEKGEIARTVSLIEKPDDAAIEDGWLYCYLYSFYSHFGLQPEVDQKKLSLGDLEKMKISWNFDLFLLYRSGVSPSLSKAENDGILRKFLKTM